MAARLRLSMSAVFSDGQALDFPFSFREQSIDLDSFAHVAGLQAIGEESTPLDLGEVAAPGWALLYHAGDEGTIVIGADGGYGQVDLLALAPGERYPLKFHADALPRARSTVAGAPLYVFIVEQ